MFNVFFEIERQYPHFDHNYTEGANEMVHYLLKAQALIAQEGEAGLQLGVRTANMMLFLANRTEYADLGLAGLQYLRQYYHSPNMPEDSRLLLARSMVYYLPRLAGMVQISRKEFEEYVTDAREIVRKSGEAQEFLECYLLQALRTMGEVQEAKKGADHWRERQWNEEIEGCRSCSQAIRAQIALCYEDLPQALGIAEEWLDGTCKPCTRGPQGVFGQLALACLQQGDSGNAARLTNKMEQVLQESKYRYVTREGLLHLLQYYLDTAQWGAAEKWFRELAPGALSTIFSVQRLQFLRAGLHLMDHWMAIGEEVTVFPEEAIPIAPDGNGNFNVRDMQNWFKAEADALRQLINVRNGNRYY